MMQFIQIPFIYNIVPNFTVSFCQYLPIPVIQFLGCSYQR